jgi:predicted nucleic acid-binding protein
MRADLAYFDSSYLVRLYLEDNGYEKVRKLASQKPSLVSAWHGRAEVVAALHRAYREGRFTKEHYDSVAKQFYAEQRGKQFVWCPLTEKVQERLNRGYRTAPADTFLRAADALHLACAAEHGFREVYSNDRHFLAAAPHFGLKGINVIV